MQTQVTVWFCPRALPGDMCALCAAERAGEAGGWGKFIFPDHGWPREAESVERETADGGGGQGTLCIVSPKGPGVHPEEVGCQGALQPAGSSPTPTGQ